MSQSEDKSIERNSRYPRRGNRQWDRRLDMADIRCNSFPVLLESCIVRDMLWQLQTK